MRRRITSLVLITVLATVGGYAGEEKESRKQEMEKNREQRKEQRMEMRKQREAEGKEFRESIKDLSIEERTAAMKVRCTTNYEEDVALINAKYNEKTEEFTKRISEAKGLTQEQRDAKMAVIEKRYQEIMAKRKTMFDERMAFLDATPEEREEMKNKMQERRKERKSEHKKMRQQRQECSDKKS